MVDSVQLIPKNPKKQEDIKSLNYLNYQEKRLFAIQRSTRPLFKSVFLQRIIEKMRIRFRWYYYWRIDPIYLYDEPDQQIYAIQQSTKTTFRKLQPLNEYFRRKSAWYYKWHIRPASNKIHFAVLAAYCIGIMFAAGAILSTEHPKQTKANYQFQPISSTLVVGTEQPINSASAASSEGVNVGSWKGVLADDNYHWMIGSTSAGYDLNLTVAGVALNGANSMIIETELDQDATVPNTLIQICDWTSSTGVDNPADAYCTTGGWRTLNIAKTAITSASPLQYRYQIYDGYWGDGATALSTPLTNFIDGSNQTKIRYFSTINTTSVVAIDFLRITANINPVYGTSGMTNLNPNTGVITVYHNRVNASTIDDRFIYSCGDDASYFVNIEKRLLDTGAVDFSSVVGGLQGESCQDIKVDKTSIYIIANGSGTQRLEKRLISNASLNTNFGTNGVISWATSNYTLNKILIFTDNIYLIGSTSTPDWRIEKRRLSDGALDTNFGTNGVIISSSTTSNGVKLNTDGNYLYAVGTNSSNNSRIEKRRLSDGSLDTNFGTAGIINGAAETSTIADIRFDQNYIYTASSTTTSDWRIEKRLLSDGSLDTNFGTAGIINGSAETSTVYSLNIDTNYMYITGTNSTPDWRIEKRQLSDGALDTNFGISGILTCDSSTDYMVISNIDSSYMYIVGVQGSYMSADWRYEKRKLSDGSLDASSLGNTGFGLTFGKYTNSLIGYNGSTTLGGSDDLRSGASGTASSIADFYYSFKNVKTYSTMNTILVRSETSCDVVGINYRPKIYNFNTTFWEDLTTGNIACSTTDATNAWTKNNITIANYISNGEIRVGYYGLANGTQTIRSDWIYLMLGTTNTTNDASNCFISMGTNSVGDCTGTRDLDMTAALPTTWNIASELESNTLAHDFFPLDFTSNATAENTAASHIKFNVVQPANTAITGMFYAGRFMSGTSGTSNLGLMDYSGYNGLNGGFSDVGSPYTTTLQYTDSTQYGTATGGLGNAGWDGIINNPFSYLQSGRNEMWMRLRNSAVTTGSVVNQWDFAMVSMSWIEDSTHPTKSYQFTPTGGNLVTGTTQPIQASTAAAAEGVNTGSWKGTIADDNFHWQFASTTTGYDANLEFANVALNGANQMMIQTIFDLDATAPDTLIQICDWTSAVGVNYPADAQCTTGGWRNLSLRNTISNATTESYYHYQIYDGYWGNGSTAISTPLTNFINVTDSNKVKIRYYSTTNTTSQVAIDMARIYPVINSIYSPSGFTNLNTNTGVITGVAASQNAYATAKDDRYLYTCGDDSSTYLRVEKRLLGTGGLDYNFGTSGVITGATTSRACKAIAIDGTWMYLAATDSTSDWRIEKRRLSDGSLDPNFGTAGIITGASASTTINAIAIDSTYMYLAGTDSTTTWRVEKRLLSNGSLDGNYGTSGVIQVTVLSGAPLSITLDATYAYFSGQENLYVARFEKRALSNGALDSGFGTGGVISDATFYAPPRRILNTGGYLYVAGGGVVPEDYEIIEKRSVTDGGLDTNFGTNGTLTGTGLYVPNDCIADSTYLYTIGYKSSDWRIEKRLLTTGALDSSFGTSGGATSAAASNTAFAAVLDSTYLYIIGTDTTPDWRIEKRKLSDGSFDNSASGNSGFGLSLGGYENSIIARSAVISTSAANTNQNGSDGIYSGGSGTAASITDFYYSFKNVKTYTGMNTISVRASTACSATGVNIRPKIYNFNSTSWEDLSTGSLPCQPNSTTVNMWAKNNATIANYISNGEIRVGFYGLANGTQIVYVDYIYLQLGTTNTDSATCDISFGTNNSGDCTATRDIDTSAPSQNIWKINKELESTAFSHTFYASDNDADADIELASAAHVKFSVTPPTGTITAINYAWGATPGVSYNYGTTGTILGSIFDYSGFTGTLGGFTQTSGSLANSLSYMDPFVNGSVTDGGMPGRMVNPHFYANTGSNEMWLRFRTNIGAITTTNIPTLIDFAMVGLQWVE